MAMPFVQPTALKVITVFTTTFSGAAALNMSTIHSMEQLRCFGNRRRLVRQKNHKSMLNGASIDSTEAKHEELLFNKLNFETFKQRQYQDIYVEQNRILAKRAEEKMPEKAHYKSEMYAPRPFEWLANALPVDASAPGKSESQEERERAKKLKNKAIMERTYGILAWFFENKGGALWRDIKQEYERRGCSPMCVLVPLYHSMYFRFCFPMMLMIGGTGIFTNKYMGEMYSDGARLATGGCCVGAALCVIFVGILCALMMKEIVREGPTWSIILVIFLAMGYLYVSGTAIEFAYKTSKNWFTTEEVQKNILADPKLAQLEQEYQAQQDAFEAFKEEAARNEQDAQAALAEQAQEHQAMVDELSNQLTEAQDQVMDLANAVDVEGTNWQGLFAGIVGGLIFFALIALCFKTGFNPLIIFFFWCD